MQLTIQAVCVFSLAVLSQQSISLSSALDVICCRWWQPAQEGEDQEENELHWLRETTDMFESDFSLADPA